MNRFLVLPVILFLLVCLSLAANAQLIMNPSSSCSPGGIELSPSIAYSEIEYKGKDDEDAGNVKVKRYLTGLNGAWGVNDWFDIYASLGFIAKAEPDPDEGNWDDNGNGFISAAGIRGVNFENDYISVMSYAQLSFISEDYGETSETATDDTGTSKISVETSAEIFDVALGAIVKGYVADRFSLYGGLEFIPYSDGKAKYSTKIEHSGSAIEDHDLSDKIERDKLFTLRLGANYELEQWLLRGEIGLISETSVLLGAGFLF